MSRFSSRSVMAGLTLIVLTLELACTRMNTETVCVETRYPAEKIVVSNSMEWAYDKVNFGFCRDQKCLVKVDTTGADCDIPDVQGCVIRHIQAANGMAVEQESEATVKITSIINRIHYERDQPMYGSNKFTCEFMGTMEIKELRPGGAKRVVKLYAYASKRE